MVAQSPPDAPPPPPANPQQVDRPAQHDRLLMTLRWLMVVALVYTLILAVGMIGSGFKGAAGGDEGARRIFAFAANPVIALFMGLFATSVVQSSSTVTSVIVGLVAAGLPVQIAIPMVMGANIGTTVTNTLVSLAHIGRPQEFQRAYAAATVHDMFNLLVVIIFLPMEMATGFLSRLSSWLLGSGSMGNASIIKDLNFIKPITKPVIKNIHGLLETIGLGAMPAGIVLAALGLTLVFCSIMVLGKLLKSLLQGRAEAIFHSAVGRGPIRGITSGTVVTVLVQSSSTTTSLVVPMAGAGILRLEKIFPFTLGANIGTCITALLAATAGNEDPVRAQAMLQIALVHLLFNLIGILVIYPLPFLRAIPLRLAEGLAAITVRRRWVAFAWILGVYFLLPLTMIIIMELAGYQPKLPTQKAETTTEQSDPQASDDAATSPPEEPDSSSDNSTEL